MYAAPVSRNRSLSNAGTSTGSLLSGTSENHSDNDESESSQGSEEHTDARARANRPAYWKNRPRNSISRTQKRLFYSWLLEHTRFPFPTENERAGVLAHDPISERQFKYWFANIRCRQFTKHRDPDGNLYFVPSAKFYESCIRLGLPIGHEIPSDVRQGMRILHRSSSRKD
ncbi:hypothetical protein LPJ61_001297 [Coemansia biformis]|uniref:Homeobox domain-containing protein n=1 Tax=Coemansia biformis TaxID=1286918 RepID=A0A9W7YFG1_9FUNG|nr:hypothetical protein LPJ61_001297 [Coemansia biformis]